MAMMQSNGAAGTRVAGTMDDPAIDRAHLFRMTLGDRALEREVLVLFDRQIEMLIGRMREPDPSGLAELAHTLKGAALGVGAWPMARAAEAVEAAPPAQLASAVAALAAAAGETRGAIAGILGTIQGPFDDRAL
jgi:HPt (histidine-containing phosphotransfer) domain-containing protein